MIKQQYETKFGAIWNLISSRNYSMPLFYKGLYILYYFVTISVILELLFDKTYILLALISSLIIVINGRKYDDSEQQYIEYLPISMKNKIRYIYYTTYVSIFLGGILAFILDFIYNRVSVIEYIYAIIVVIALSNFAITQMVNTKKSLIYFFIWDILIYQFIVSIVRFILLGVYKAYTEPIYDNTQFSIIKILILILLVVVYHFICVYVINSVKKSNKVNKNERIKLVIILVLLLITGGYKFYLDAGRDFGRGVKEASETGSVTIYENSIKEQNNIR